MTTLAIPADITMRPAKDGDQQGIAALLHDYERTCFGEFISPLSSTLDWIRETWQTRGFDLPADSLVAVTPTEQIIGYVTVWRTENEPHKMIASPRTHSTYHGQGLGTWMLRWAERRARQIAEGLPEALGAVLSTWVDEVDTCAQELVTREGFAPDRYWWRMEIQLEAAPPVPTWPEGIHVRTFVPGQDERATYEMLAEAFTTPQGDAFDTFEAWLLAGVEATGFDPSLWFLALDDHNEIVGAALDILQTGEKRQVGWIGELAVRPSWRKRGLALALLYHSFGEFYRRGIVQCGLSVDAANPSGATRLYQRAGMHADNHTSILYRKELRPAIA